MPNLWLSCNHSRRCPVCNGADRCSQHVGGNLGCCREPEANEGREPRYDSTGQPFWIWRYDEIINRTITPLTEEVACADEATRDRAYRCWFGGGLTERHTREICKRYGVAYEDRSTLPLTEYASLELLNPVEVIRSMALRLHPEEMLQIPGIYQNDNGLCNLVPSRWKNGILIACKNIKGEITALKVRFDEKDKFGNRYRYVSSSRYHGAAASLGVHFGDTPRATDTTIRITEGEFKANVATYISETLTISIPGVASWRTVLPVLKQMTEVKRVLLAFDSDAYTNPDVARSLQQLATEVIECSGDYELGIETWPADYKGIDDYLISGGVLAPLFGSGAVSLVREICRLAGLENADERLAELVQRIADTQDERILTEREVIRFCGTLNEAKRFEFDTDVRRILGPKYRAQNFRRVVKEEQRNRQTHNTITVTTPIEGGDSDDSPIPIIETHNKATSEISGDAVKALGARNSIPRIFYFGDTVSRLCSQHGRDYQIDVLNVHSLKAELERSARWFRTTGNTRTEVPCPKDVSLDLLNYPEAWNGLPRIEGVVGYPCFDRDGRFVCSPGFNADSGLVLNVGRDERIQALPERITDDQIRWAKDLLAYMLCDFPFDGPVSYANALALFLLQPVRFMIDGPTPLHALDAPREGSGKGLLYDALTMPWIPRGVPSTPAPKTSEEWDKALLSLFLKSPTHILFDNIARTLESDSLALALTQQTYSSRILGRSKMAEVPIRAIFAATGNNVTASAEMARRMIIIRLDSNLENPSDRQNFTIPDLRRWVVEHREELMTAGLYLVKAWLDSGRPLYTKVLGSYTAWSQIIGGILQVAGIPSFMEEMAERREEMAVERSEWSRLISDWWIMHRHVDVTPQQLYPLAEGLEIDFGRAGSDQRGRHISFSHKLGKLVDQVFCGKKVLMGRSNQRVKTFRLQVVDVGRHQADMESRGIKE